MAKRFFRRGPRATAKLTEVTRIIHLSPTADTLKPGERAPGSGTTGKCMNTSPRGNYLQACKELMAESPSMFPRALAIAAATPLMQREAKPHPDHTPLGGRHSTWVMSILEPRL